MLKTSSRARFLALAVPIACLLLVVVDLANGFVPAGVAPSTCHPRRPALRPQTPWLPPAAAASDPLNDLSEERQANLFQFLLRDLQVEGVPLLGVDADQVHTLQAALWTTLAELSEQADEQSACLIFESIPVSALRAFVDDFLILTTQQERLMQNLPELQRFRLSLVGKGVGPAILIQANAKPEASSTTTTTTSTDAAEIVQTNNENQQQAALQRFVNRMVAGRQIAGLSSSEEDGNTGITFRTAANTPEVCHILSAFWNCVCELLAAQEPNNNQKSMTLLTLPTNMDLERFSAVSELLSRSLCLYRGDDVFELLHLHPHYDRNAVYPPDKPAHGHIPPLSWLRPMLLLRQEQQDGDGSSSSAAAPDDLSDEDMALMNYLRRAPTPGVCIVPVDLLETNMALSEQHGNGVVNLELSDGSVVQASGVASYAQSVLDLSQQGEAQLAALWQEEMEMSSQS